MSRARAPSGPSISLFPFLAVLLCTMGALLVLLVLFSRSAKQGDGAAEVAAHRALEEELELARDELKWRLEQVQAVRSRTQADLAKVRMQLAGTEETMRALADELEALERTAAALEGERPAAAEQIEDLERRLTEARKAVEKAKDAAESRPPAYAVVPYEGANGTHRRPLYIECCIDGVFLQPEGIRLGPADFEGPPGPGNPLASALRAAREYIARNPGESGDPNAQPYPLLLVRPSGVMAYYAARESIQSWGSEFGYQFVDEEWEITYPARDPGLADAEKRAVEEARRRLEWLAQVRPAKPSRPATTYRAATTRGGVVSNGGPSVLGDQSRWDWTEEQAAAQGRPGRGFAGGDAAGNGGIGGDGSGSGDAILGGGGSGSSGFGGGDGAGGPGRGVVAGEPAGAGSRYSGPSKFYSSTAAPGGDGTGDGGAGSGEGGPANGDLAAADAGGAAGSRGGRAGGSSRFAGPAGSASAAGGPGGDQPGGSAAGGSGGSVGSGGGEGGGGSGSASASGGSGGGGGGSFGPSMPGLHQPGGGAAGGSAGGAAGGSASLAGSRGSNWASLATQDRPVPLTRPIRLECAADEFRILGDGGRVQSRIPIGSRTIDSVDPLVREVHATVGRWGIAGDRMYWKPELVLSATADGTGRRDDLERLLTDSGIDTRRSGEADRVRNLPPVQRTSGILKRR